MTARGFDWLRLVQRVTTFVRALREDPELELDTQAARADATQVRSGLEHVARAALGCKAPEPCSCAVCAEKSGQTL